MLARVVAAVLGGYGLAALAAVAVAVLVPGLRADAVLWGMLAGPLVMVGAAMWAVAAHDAGRAWAGLLLAAIPPGLAVVAHKVGWLP